MEDFKYDSLSSNMVRYFKLDVDTNCENLSGTILTCHETRIYNLEAFQNLFTEDMESTLKHFGSGYDALSYCWGNPQEYAKLHLSVMANKLDENGDVQLDHEPDRNGSICINENLFVILQELRRRKHNRFIWIDAICINQQNEEEKSRQIPWMRDIYEEATNVYVWLGQMNDMENGALTIMPKLTEILVKASQVDQVLDPTAEEDFEKIGLPEPSHGIWKAVRDIFHRPWWSRLWTLQEVVVTGSGEETWPNDEEVLCQRVRVIFGQTVATMKVFNDFALAATAAGIKEWILSGDSGLAVTSLHGFDGLSEIRTCRESIKRYGFGVSLSALLLGTQRRQATVPADMVIGMLAMLDRSAAHKLERVMNNTTRSVFVSFSKHYIRNETKEVLLNHIARKELNQDLPSWCPNFASPPDSISLGSRWLGHFESSSAHRLQMYCAGFQKKGKWKRPKSKLYYVKNITNAMIARHPHSGLFDTKNPRQITLVPDTDHLSVSGIWVDRIVAIVDCNPATESAKFLSFDSVQQAYEWEHSCLALAKSTLPTGIEGFNLYARTLVANRVTMDAGADEPIVFDRWNQYDFTVPYFALKRYMQTVVTLGESVPEYQNLDSSALRYVKVLEQVTRRRRFFSTVGGRIGLGPADTSIGDQVCVFFYCPTPYLLRQKAEERYHFVGESFVDGFMYGEVLEQFDKGKIQERKWIIE